MSQIGGGGQKKTKNVWNSDSDIWNPIGGGVSIFQKCLNHKLLSDPILSEKLKKKLNLLLFKVNMSK